MMGLRKKLNLGEWKIELVPKWKSLWKREKEFREEPYAVIYFEDRILKVVQAKKSQRQEDERGYIEWLCLERNEAYGNWDIVMFKHNHTVNKKLWLITRERLAEERADMKRRKCEKIHEN